MFVDTWMAGGIGPRPGRLRRDGLPRRWCGTRRAFYDPLGLASEGTKIDFQLQINSYLYGTRFMTWLARTLRAREAGRVGRRAGRAAGPTTPRSSSRCSAGRSRRPGREWIDAEQTFQQPNLDAIRQYPVTPYRGPLAARARVGVARLLRPSRARNSTPRSTTRASSRTSARSTRRRGVGRAHSSTSRGRPSTR